MRQSKRTKIVCTIGPASNDPATVRKMIRAGMNVARLNFSHGTHEDHAKMIAMLRQVSQETGEPVAILQDLQGPKIRVGKLPEEGVMLEEKKEVVFTTDPKAKLPKMPVDYPSLHIDVRTGDKLLLDDGLIDVRVTKVIGQDIICEVVHGGKLTSHKGINLPTATLSTPAITVKDMKDLKFGVAQGVDWVALSFVRNAKEIYDLRYMIQNYEKELGIEEEHGRQPIRIVAKIEKHEAIRSIDEIVEAVDGIMVARGDLGIETPAEELPLIQKMLIDKCLAAAKPVIVATQMLDSMIRNPRPTRAEVSDVANAVIDHTDAVMLSGETATGKFPVDVVATMARIVHETESSRFDDLDPDFDPSQRQTIEEAISGVGNILARGIKARLVLVASLTGNTGRIVSRYRPELPILVATDNERVRNQLNLSWGVVPFVLPRCGSVEELVDRSIGHLKKNKMIKKNDKIIIVAGSPVGVAGGVNLVEIRDIK
ncbi:hypothetical protein AMJ57_01680 [Parcubacteria bacterium SG8_24]|nr:MAG: hypothetical protein AMJ57_01680 [Parcubacteria bacterium SG8_24]